MNRSAPPGTAAGRGRGGGGLAPLPACTPHPGSPGLSPSYLGSTSTYAAGAGPGGGHVRGPAPRGVPGPQGTAKATDHSVQSGQCCLNGCRREGPCPVGGREHPRLPRDAMAEQDSARQEGAGGLETIHSFIHAFIHSLMCACSVVSDSFVTP